MKKQILGLRAMPVPNLSQMARRERECAAIGNQTLRRDCKIAKQPYKQKISGRRDAGRPYGY